MFTRMPAWGVSRIVMSEDSQWITRSKVPEHFGYEAEYPGLGRWPKIHFWNKIIRRRGGTISIRLPGILCSRYQKDAHYEWYVPVNHNHYRYLQFLVRRARGWRALAFRLGYWLYRRWLFHVQFNNQDAWMVRLMPETAPESLFRPDVSIKGWRRLCEHARGEAPPANSLAEQLREAAMSHGLSP